MQVELNTDRELGRLWCPDRTRSCDALNLAAVAWSASEGERVLASGPGSPRAQTISGIDPSGHSSLGMGHYVLKLLEQQRSGGSVLSGASAVRPHRSVDDDPRGHPLAKNISTDPDRPGARANSASCHQNHHNVPSDEISDPKAVYALAADLPGSGAHPLHDLDGGGGLRFRGGVARTPTWPTDPCGQTWSHCTSKPRDSAIARLREKGRAESASDPLRRFQPRRLGGF
jgi:hypothetical protein